MRKKTTTPSKPDKALQKPEPTPEQQARIDRRKARQEIKPVKIEKLEDGTTQITDGGDELVETKQSEYYATGDQDLQRFLGMQIAHTFKEAHTGITGDDTKTLNVLMAQLAEIQPRDQLEVMLVSQMLAVHNASMECFSRAMIRDQRYEAKHENLRQAVKLARTYTAQLQAFKAYRGETPKKVNVGSVNVADGGQAVVGNVEHPNGGRK